MSASCAEPDSCRQVMSAGKGHGSATADLARVGGGCLGGPRRKVSCILKAPGGGGLHHLHACHRRLRCAVLRCALQDTGPAVSSRRQAHHRMQPMAASGDTDMSQHVLKCPHALRLAFFV